MEGRTPQGDGKDERGGAPAGLWDRLRSRGSDPRELPRGLSPRSRRALVVAAGVGVLFAAYSIFSAGPDSWWSLDPTGPEGPATEEGGGSGPPGESPDLALIVVNPGVDATETAGEDPGELPAENAGEAGDAEVDLSPPNPETFIWPVAGTVATRFGWQYSDRMEDWRYHEGIHLLPDEEEAAVLAVADGMVAEVALEPGGGWQVEIDHGPGYRTRYANLAGVHVSPGDEVARGDSIGTAGSSAGEPANGDPEPLEFVVIWNDAAVDPLAVLPSKR